MKSYITVQGRTTSSMWSRANRLLLEGKRIGVMLMAPMSNFFLPPKTGNRMPPGNTIRAIHPIIASSHIFLSTVVVDQSISTAACVDKDSRGNAANIFQLDQEVTE